MIKATTYGRSQPIGAAEAVQRSLGRADGGTLEALEQRVSRLTDVVAHLIAERIEKMPDTHNGLCDASAFLVDCGIYDVDLVGGV